MTTLGEDIQLSSGETLTATESESDESVIPSITEGQSGGKRIKRKRTRKARDKPKKAWADRKVSEFPNFVHPNIFNTLEDETAEDVMKEPE